MSDPPELWAFVLSNVLVLVLGGVLTGLSMLAYRREETRAYGLAAVGFGLISSGAIAEGVYQLGIRRSYELGGRELLSLQTVEGLLIAAGLATLFYSLRQY